MKKLSLLLLGLTLSLGIHAQFQEGKGYLGASLTGLDLHYNGHDKFNIGLEAKVGYLPWDDIMLLASVSAEHNGSKAVADHIVVGAGARYYILKMVCTWVLVVSSCTPTITITICCWVPK